ncbi:MAG: hypothetical protein ACI8RZ_001838 [Myxococcota bacterium]
MQEKTMRNLLLIPLALAACDEEPSSLDGGQFGEETGAGCTAVSTVPLEIDEVSPFGFTPREVHDLVVGTHSTTLTWDDGSATPFTVTVDNPGAASWVEYEYLNEDGSESMNEIGCAYNIEMTVDLTLVTEDGAFNETLSVLIQAPSSDWVNETVAMEALSGSFSIEQWADASYDSVTADMMLNFESSGIYGEIDGYGESSSGSGDSGTVSLNRFTIATF